MAVKAALFAGLLMVGAPSFCAPLDYPGVNQFAPTPQLHKKDRQEALGKDFLFRQLGDLLRDRKPWSCNEGKNEVRNLREYAAQIFRGLPEADKKAFSRWGSRAAKTELAAALKIVSPSERLYQIDEILRQYRFTDDGNWAAQTLIEELANSKQYVAASFYADGWLRDFGNAMDICNQQDIPFFALIAKAYTGADREDDAEKVLTKIEACISNPALTNKKIFENLDWWPEAKRFATENVETDPVLSRWLSWEPKHSEEEKLQRVYLQRAVTYGGDGTLFYDLLSKRNDPHHKGFITFCELYSGEDLGTTLRLVTGANFFVEENIGLTDLTRKMKDVYLPVAIRSDQDRKALIKLTHIVENNRLESRELLPLYVRTWEDPQRKVWAIRSIVRFTENPTPMFLEKPEVHVETLIMAALSEKATRERDILNRVLEAIPNEKTEAVVKALINLLTLSQVDALAAESLGKFGPKAQRAVNALLVRLEAPNESRAIKFVVIDSLRKIVKGNPQSELKFAQALRRENFKMGSHQEVIWSALLELGQLKELVWDWIRYRSSAVDDVERKNNDRMRKFFSALDEESRARVTPWLTEFLTSGSHSDVHRAIIALGAVGKPARKSLITLIRLRDRAVEGPIKFHLDKAIHSILATYPEDSIPELVADLKSENAETRLVAIHVLTAYRQLPQKAVYAVIVAALSSTDPEMRVMGRKVFEGFIFRVDRENAAEVVEGLKLFFEGQFLSPEYFLYREYVCARFGDLNSAAKEAIPELLQSLEDQNDRVRLAASRALGRVGVKTDEIKKALQKRFTDKPEIAQEAYRSFDVLSR